MMRVAIVGCGRMGRERARAADALGVGAILLFDEDRSRAESLARECARASPRANLATLLEEKPDAIFICTPPFCRGTLENRAIELGIPFFVEKPIGVSAHQVQTVLDNLCQCEVLNAVGYMNRYRNSIAHARAILQSQNIVGVTAHWVGKKYGVPWWAVREQSGGPFNEQATHVMDLFRYLSGVTETLHAAAHPLKGIETTVVVTLRLAGGGLGTFLYSCEAKDKDILISIETTDGVLDLRGWDLELARNTIDGSCPEPELKPIFEKETHSFLQAVATGDRTLILSDFAEAYKTQMAMDSVARIIRSNCRPTTASNPANRIEPA
jgi:myo-inositol 2-dehydrogenase/D-chiro-inositol 1-dehydrogenase